MSQNNISQHHQHVRKRIHKNLENYPHSNKQKRIVDKLVYVLGVLTPVSTLPQVLKIWMNRSATDVSIFTWLPYLFFAIIWLWYGVVHKEKPIIFLNIGLVIVNFLTVLGIILFG